MLAAAGSGHPGGSLSAVELLVGLYFKYMKFDPRNPLSPDRDYFILSKGHVCPVLYAIMAELECIGCDELCSLRKIGSRLQGHPAKDKELPGIEVSTGSLGYGLNIGVGVAVGLKADRRPNRVYVLMGDGEQQEGSVWEAAMAAAHFKLDNLCAIIDYNKLQIDGKVSDVMEIAPLAEKYRAFGWNAIEIDGHQLPAVLDAYAKAAGTGGKPTVIVAHTVKGKGVSFMENNADWHGKTPSKEQLEKALQEIGS
jgi:transketolase